MANDVIYLDNDGELFLEGLTDKDGNYVNDATVTATLYDVAGTTEITGPTWPVTLTYVAGSNGDYAYTLDKAVSIEINTQYKVKFIVLYGGTSDGVFWKDIVARRRVV